MSMIPIPIDILSKYNDKTILVIDDINDTGTTLTGIDNVIKSLIAQKII